MRRRIEGLEKPSGQAEGGRWARAARLCWPGVCPCFPPKRRPVGGVTGTTEQHRFGRKAPGGRAAPAGGGLVRCELINASAQRQSRHLCRTSESKAFHQCSPRWMSALALGKQSPELGPRGRQEPREGLAGWGPRSPVLASSRPGEAQVNGGSGSGVSSGWERACLGVSSDSPLMTCVTLVS